MEIVFIRHAQGEHTINLPNSLDIRHPALTEKGKVQARNLTDIFDLKPTDIIISSPTRRTIETTNIFTERQNLKKYISPFIGPRMFPQNPEWITLACDEIYRRQDIEELYREFEIVDFNEDLWTTKFKGYVHRFIEWNKTLNCRIYLVTHDGTINNYRKIIGEEHVTRDDFVGEAGWYKMIL
ncbi:histidine phosphatase family protein [Paenibacillus sp. D2_2]|uniref:histidine phosphatase family protein n=1 Tax=Paenibacillus sp. D2_2 TaxID=3073092 RepID=UPI0028151A9C|nr:histidine phosphatase family protein [Paenibacillus sp. D2_2]WMT39680.1 histidine phosphatase family protein [Paenibacillus sp. D2_2]